MCILVIISKSTPLVIKLTAQLPFFDFIYVNAITASDVLYHQEKCFVN